MNNTSTSNPNYACALHSIYSNANLHIFGNTLPFAAAILDNAILLSFVIIFIYQKSNGRERPSSQLNCFIFSGTLAALLSSAGNLWEAIEILRMIADRKKENASTEHSYFLYFFRDSLFNVAHINFALILTLNSLLYFAMPLHYHIYITTKRCIAVCAVMWIVAFVEALQSIIPANFFIFGVDAGFVAIMLIFKVLPVLCAFNAAAAITLVLYRASRRHCGQSPPKLTSIWKSVFKVFRVPMFISLAFCPIIVFVSVIIFSMNKHSYHESFLCENYGAGLFAFFFVLWNLYLFGIPIFIVITHPIYWKNMKHVLTKAQRRLSQLTAETTF